MKKHLLFFTLLLVSIGNAQVPGDVAQNFGSYTGFNDNIQAIALQSDGKILLGGKFTIYKGLTENKIIRLNADGSKDTAFVSGSGFGGPIYVIVIQNDGKILVGGNFTTYKGLTENYIIRLNSDGSKDTSFNAGTGFNNSVQAITIQNDGKILTGGTFTTYKGLTENCIIRLNPDGSKDTSFVTGNGFNTSPSTIALQSDGKIIIGGYFTTYKGLTENYIIRLNSDGSKDTSFITGTGFSYGVSSIVLQSDGKILVGGNFGTYKGLTENYIIRLNLDGSKDTSFNTGTGVNAGFNYFVSIIVMQNDGKILVGGGFYSYQGETERHLIRLNSDGSKQTSFNSGTGFNGQGAGFAIQSDGKILIGGDFYSYQGITENKIIRLNADGSKDTSFNSGIGFNTSPYNQRNTATIGPIKIQSNGKILVGGYFSYYKGVLESNIIRLNSDGSKDTSFVTGSGFDNSVNSIEIQNDGKILLGGVFYFYQGISANRIIRLNPDGSIDTSFNTGTGIDGFAGVNIIKLQNDGKILVGGNFNMYNGRTENSIIRLNSDGSKDTSFVTGTGFNVRVCTIVIQNDGKILVGGIFNSYNGITEYNIIRLNSNGTKDTSFISGTGFNNIVNNITLQNDGKILVGGGFTTYKGLTENCIIRLNPDGSKDTSFLTGAGFDQGVGSILVQNDGKILISGRFLNYKNINESALIIKLYGISNLEIETNLELKSYIIFPNPAKEQITIDFGNTSNVIGGNYRIINMLGQEVQNGDLNSQQNTLELSSIKEQGIYFVKVYDSSNSLLDTKKIIIQQ